MVRDSVTSCAALHKSISTGLRKYLFVFHDKDCDKFFIKHKVPEI